MNRVVAADRLCALASRDPELVLRSYPALLDGPAEARVVARHAACLAHAERGEPVSARQHARLALRAAARAGLPERVAQVRLTMAWLAIDGGRPQVGLAQLDRALPWLRGADLAKARCLSGLVRCDRGEPAAAAAELTAALAGLRAEPRWRANALVARGVAHCYDRRCGAAAADFVAAQQLWTAEGLLDRAAACVHNEGFAALCHGDLPGALALFDRAEHLGLDQLAHPETLVDRAEALLAAGLPGAAHPVLDRAATLLEAAGRGSKLAEARLTAASCALDLGNHAAAVEAAAAAERLFRQQRRASWVPLAAAVGMRARWAAGSAVPGLLARAGRVATACERHGWSLAAAGLRIDAARAARQAGRTALAVRLLEAAGRGGGVGLPVGMKWLARAELGALRRDRPALLGACRAGLRALDGWAGAAGVGELGTRAGQLVAELAGLALDELVGRADARTVLRWTEQQRAGVLARPSVRPPEDSALAGALDALRGAAARLRGEVAAGRPAEAARGQVAELERVVRRRALGIRRGDRGVRRSCAEVDDRLGESVLLSFFVHRGQVYVNSIVDGRVRLVRLGAAIPVEHELAALRFACCSEDPRPALAVGARHAAAVLDSLLMAPLADVVGDRPLVLVPAGELQALPWAALPSCVGRELVVAPSIACWLAAQERRPAGRTLLASGPDLPFAEREVLALQRLWGGVRISQSTVDGLLTGADGAGLLHVAAHGRFRVDQPLFSCLELADGPLYVYDLDRLRRAPGMVVLSACEAGLAAVRPGAGTMGLAAALLARGTGTLIASVTPVPDERSADLMLSLYTGLRTGLRPAAALAKAQAEHGDLGFLCFGSSTAPVNPH